MGFEESGMWSLGRGAWVVGGSRVGSLIAWNEIPLLFLFFSLSIFYRVGFCFCFFFSVSWVEWKDLISRNTFVGFHSYSYLDTRCN